MDALFIGAIVLGVGLLILGFVGCIVPALPGPPFAFLALIILDLAETTIF